MDRDEELFRAVKQRNEWSIINELIEAGADVNHVSEDPHDFGRTPLHKSQDPEVTALLIENGAELNSLDVYGFTPLHYAVVDGWYNKTAALIYFGADPCLPSYPDRVTPLMRCFTLSPIVSCPVAVRSAMIELLLNFQDDINQVGRFGSSAVTLALFDESPHMDNIIEQGGNFNNLFHDSTLLFHCILEKDKVEFEWLWDGFHYIESWDIGISVLRLTLLFCRYECFEYVLHSPKIQDVIKTFTVCDDPIQGILLATNSDDIPYSKEKAKEAIFVLLTRGYVPAQREIHCAFKAYGYCELTELLLHLFEPVSYHTPWYPLIPNILLNPDKCIKIMMSKTLTYHTVNKEGLVEAIPYVFNQKMFQRLELYYKLDENMLEKLRQRRVPSLMEISRNNARLAIWKGYNIENVGDFYRTLRFMNLPQLIKDIIRFQKPLYYY